MPTAVVPQDLAPFMLDHHSQVQDMFVAGKQCIKVSANLPAPAGY